MRYIRWCMILVNSILWSIKMMKTCPELKVNFLVVGAQKAGTSALDYYLRKYFDVVMPISAKEIHHFDNELNMRLPLKLRNALYHYNFKGGSLEKIWGEVTPIYMFKEKYVERIKRYNCEMKIVVCLRDPVSRAYSQWNMERIRGRECRPFMKAISDEVDNEAVPQEKAYMRRSLYSSQIKTLVKFFGKDNIFFMKQEDLLEAPEEVLLSLADFLGVVNLPFKESVIVHKREYDGTVSENDMKILGCYFIDDIIETEKILGWDLSSWKNGFL